MNKVCAERENMEQKGQNVKKKHNLVTKFLLEL